MIGTSFVSMYAAGIQQYHSYCQVLHCVQRESHELDIRSPGRNYLRILQKSKRIGELPKLAEVTLSDNLAKVPGTPGSLTISL